MLCIQNSAERWCKQLDAVNQSVSGRINRALRAPSHSSLSADNQGISVSNPKKQEGPVRRDEEAILRFGWRPPNDGLYRDSMSEAVRTILQTNDAAAREPAGGTEAGFLWDFWYPAVRSAQIRGNRLVAAMLLEVPLVLGRTAEGKAFAMRDSCPHRGIPLSYGHFDGRTVECSYHGWRFDACTAR